MRYLITLLLAALSLNAVGQTNQNYNPDYDNDGAISVNDLLGFLSIFGDIWASEDVIMGCTYPDAAAYNPLATMDDGSCSFTVDCACVLNGSSTLDNCGTCDDDTSNDCTQDCSGTWGGTSVLDECGVCGGGGIAVGECDCEGNILDECGICGGLGIAEGECDCDGNVLDECGICGGSGIPDGDCDCDGNVLDECGICGGLGIAEGECDCDGNVLDECGICGGDGASCDCDVPTNDECAGATVLVTGDTYTGSTCCASQESVDIPWGEFGIAYGVWFTFNSENFEVFYFSATTSQYPLNLGFMGSGDCATVSPGLACQGFSQTCSGVSDVLYDLEPNTNYYALIWTTDINTCTDFEFSINGAIFDCTDATATNYNPAATHDDGTCDFTGVVPANDICDNAEALVCNSVTVGSTGGATILGSPIGVAGCETAPGTGVWYSFVGDGQLHNLSTCGSAIDSKINIYTADVDCGGGGIDVPPADACGEGLVTVHYSVGNGSWDSEISWTLSDASGEVASGGAPVTGSVCLPEGDYTLMMTDSYGDGWNGGSATFTNGLGEVIGFFSLDTGSAGSGTLNVASYSMDPFYQAGDFICFASASSNVSSVCTYYDENDVYVNPDYENDVSLEFVSSVGTIYYVLVGSEGAAGTFDITFDCAPIVEGCMDDIACNFDPLANFSSDTCEFSTCAGCMDAAACNYDSLAAYEDGSCVYEFDECGVCGGSGYTDECGTCDNDPSNDCIPDCNGDLGGTAVLDECGVCGGDNSSCVFECGNQFPYQGYDYNTVQIGEQCWFSENLRATSYNDGTLISEVTDDVMWSALDSGARCSYQNDLTLAETYGYLYNGYTAISSLNICPVGWRVPTDWDGTGNSNAEGFDFGDLSVFIQNQGYELSEVGIALKSTLGWPMDDQATDEFGFTAIAGGFRTSQGEFTDIEDTGMWWSSSVNTWYGANDNGQVVFPNSSGLPPVPTGRAIMSGATAFYLSIYHTRVGRSIRCVEE